MKSKPRQDRQCFSIEIAQAIGVDNAILIGQITDKLRDWEAESISHNGLSFTRITPPQWNLHNPYWAPTKIRTLLKRIKASGVLKTAKNLDLDGDQGAYWYAVDRRVLNELIMQRSDQC